MGGFCCSGLLVRVRSFFAGRNPRFQVDPGDVVVLVDLESEADDLVLVRNCDLSSDI